MNPFQAIWWSQVRSDYEAFLILTKAGASPCHRLHYLQMVSEKLGKAYFWRDGRPPRRDHLSCVPFLQALAGRSDARRVGRALGFGHDVGLSQWVRTVTPLAREVEQLAPALANDGPNPEYPWPHTAPAHAPATHNFRVWVTLLRTGRGQQLLKVIDVAVARFPEYA